MVRGDGLEDFSAGEGRGTAAEDTSVRSVRQVRRGRRSGRWWDMLELICHV